MKSKRKQLTLFLPEEQSESIEKIRQEFNSIQYSLIKSHITLCREDEIEPLEQVRKNLIKLSTDQLLINLGPVCRFSEGKGVMIPGGEINEDFQLLRKKILTGIIENPRNHQPHITLMHPRNSACTKEIFEQILVHEFPAQLSFSKISLIEQEMGKKWEVLEEFTFVIS